MDIDNISMWATAISGYLFVILTMMTGLNWWFKHHLKSTLEELKPNHGSSIKDAVTEIREVVTELKVDLARLEGKVENHIREHNR